MLKFLARHSDIGQFVLRVGLGLMFVFVHGWPKLAGGPERWTSVGGSMGHLGIHFAPTFWGFMAGAFEFVGGVLLVLGLYVRQACVMILIVLIVATVSVLSRGGGLRGGTVQPIEVGIAIIALLFLGAGKYAIDKN